MTSKLEQPFADISALPQGLRPEEWLSLDEANFQTTLVSSVDVKDAKSHDGKKSETLPYHLSHKIPTLMTMPQKDLENAIKTQGKYRVSSDFIIFRSSRNPGLLFLGSNTDEHVRALQSGGYVRADDPADPYKDDPYLPTPNDVNFSRDFRDANERFFAMHGQKMIQRRTQQIAHEFGEQTQQVVAPKTLLPGTFAGTANTQALEGVVEPYQHPVQEPEIIDAEYTVVSDPKRRIAISSSLGESKEPDGQKLRFLGQRPLRGLPAPNVTGQKAFEEKHDGKDVSGSDVLASNI